MFGEIGEMADMDLEEFDSIEIVENEDGGKTLICHGFSDDLASAIIDSAGDIDSVLNIDVNENASKATIPLARIS